MEKRRNYHFYIEIKSNQNETWHGTIENLHNQKIKHFKSLLEMIKFIDSQLDTL